MRILVVEDEILTALNLCMDLKDFNGEVLPPVARGEEAVAVYKDKRPDLIFMDIRLAGTMDGIEAAERIRKINGPEICFMTGYATTAIREMVKKIKPAAFLEKPFTIADIRAVYDSIVCKQNAKDNSC
jgi:CheY-like chemotaxis protein